MRSRGRNDIYLAGSVRGRRRTSLTSEWPKLLTTSVKTRMHAETMRMAVGNTRRIMQTKSEKDKNLNEKRLINKLSLAIYRLLGFVTAAAPTHNHF